MLFLVVWTFLITSAHNGTRNYKVCLLENFKSSACWEAKQLYKAGKYGCEEVNKKYYNGTECF